MATRLMQVPIGALNEGDDPKAVPPGTLLLADNCAMDKARRLVKRAGTTSLPRSRMHGGSLTSASRLITRGSDLALADGEMLYAHSEALGKWQDIDRPSSLLVTRKPLIDSAGTVTAVDICIYGDLLITAFISGYNTNGGTLFVKAENFRTGVVEMPPVLIVDQVAYPRLVLNGSTAYVFATSHGGSVYYAAIDLLTMTPSALYPAASDAAAHAPLDAVIETPSGGVPTLYVAYGLLTGASRVAVRSYTLETLPLANVDNATLSTSSGSVGCICIAASPTEVHVMYGALPDVAKLGTLSPDLSVLIAPNTFSLLVPNWVFVAVADSQSFIMGWTDDDGGADAERFMTKRVETLSHLTFPGSARITFGLHAPSKPWKVGGRWYVGAATFLHSYNLTSTDPIPQPSSVVVEIETSDSITGASNGNHPLVAMLENQTGWWPPVNQYLMKPAVDAEGNVYLPVPFRNLEPTTAFLRLPVAWNLFQMKTGGRDLFRSAQLGRGVLCAAGAPFWYDGQSAMPYGFPHAPAILSVEPAAGGSMAVGTYSYVVTYAWRDALGLLHRSMPSPPKTGTTAGANLSLILTVSAASLSSKQRALVAPYSPSPILIEVWRTTVGATSAHYRLSREPNYQFLLNNPHVKDISLTDTKADANIASGAPALPLSAQAQLYTDVGELANVPPPAFVTVVTHRGRLVGLAPDVRTVWFSKDSTLDATLAPGFNEALTLAFASDKIALASLDEKLVVFGETTIDVVFGDGPDDKGDQNTWQIQSVQTDVGCINPRSTVTCPMGVMFLSTRGLEVLGRNLEVSWAGEGITDTLAAYPILTSATLCAKETEVRFTCNAADGLSGIVLAWNYLHKCWFVRRYTDLASPGGVVNVPFMDAALIGGVYTMVTEAAQIYRETAAHKLENDAAFVARDIVFAPISAGGNLAWHRVKDISVLGTSLTPHDFKVSLARNYDPTYEKTQTFLAGSRVTAAGPNELCRVGMTNQKCQAVTIRLQDLAPTDPSTYPVTTGEGPIIEALALRVGVQPDNAKTSAEQQG
jgi:hypothetical protein